MSSPGPNSRSTEPSNYIFFYTLSRTFGMIKPDAYTNIGNILDAIEKSGFIISNLKMTKMTLQDASQFYAEHKVKIHPIT